MSLQNRWSIVGIVIVAAIALMAVFTQMPETQAQQSAVNLRSRLEMLSTQMDNNAGFEVVVQFSRPPLATGETLINVSSQTTLQLSEVGDDYLCLAQTWNDGLRHYCTPFNNVVSVSFID